MESSNMNCHQVRERMIDYVYAELPDEERSSVESHMEQCGNCREHLAVLQRTHGLLTEAAKKEESVEAQRIAIAPINWRAHRQLETSRRRWQWFSALAATALLLVLGVGALGVRIELHRSHIVLSWGGDRITLAPPSKLVSDSGVWQRQVVDHESRLDDLDKLVHLLMQTASADERQRDREAILFARQLHSVRSQNDTRWRAIAYVMDRLNPAFKDETN